MVDFRELMTPEQRERFDRDQEYIARERLRHSSMSNADLAAHAQRCVDNSEGPRKYPAEVCCYDNAVWHFVVPELIRRVGAAVQGAAPDLDKLEALLRDMNHGKHGAYRPGGGAVWTGYFDEHGYPNEQISIQVADCSTAGSSEATWQPSEKQPERRVHALAVGRAIAALLNAAPELIRLARIGKQHELKPPTPRTPEQALLIGRISNLKHGPGGKGGKGPCDPDCEKCKLELKLKELDGE
jgi:hypothetical protein